MKFISAIASLAGLEIDDVIAGAKAKAIVTAVLAVLVGVAVIFGLVAAYVAMSAWIGPLWGALALAGIALVLALIVYIAALVADAGRRRKIEERRRSEMTSAATTAAIAAVPGLLRSPLIRRFGIPVAVAVAVVLLGSGDRD